MANDFLQAVEDRLANKPQDLYKDIPKTFAGYPVIKPDAGWDKYFKENPHVAGAAVGAKVQGDWDTNPTRAIVVNPYNKYMQDPTSREGLMMVEAVRHKIAEENKTPTFKITPEMQQWREKSFTPDQPYRTNDKAFKETLISRAVVGDIGSEFATPEVNAEADRYRNLILEKLKQEKESKPSLVKEALPLK